MRVLNSGLCIVLSWSLNLYLSLHLSRVEQRRFIPDSLLSVSRSDLVAEQRADTSLSLLFDCVFTAIDGKSVASG